jgi:hypothetical protein
MKFTKVAHCWYLIEARKKLQLGDGFLERIPDHYTEDQAQNLRNFWRTRERLSFLRENLVRASNRENAKIIEVTPDYCFEIGEKQNWLCALSGKPLEFTRGGTDWGGKWCNPMSCTIDRINSNLGYVKGNIQLVTWKVNCIKQHFDNDEFIDLCKQVSDYNK